MKNYLKKETGEIFGYEDEQFNALNESEQELFTELSLDEMPNDTQKWDAESKKFVDDLEKIKNQKIYDLNYQATIEICKLLKRDSKENALIEQANLQAEATNIIAHKALNNRYPNGGEERLKALGEMQVKIAEIIKSCRAEKQKLS